MPQLELSQAACQYLVTKFEAALSPAPKEPPVGYDLKHYSGADARLVNGLLFPVDCAISSYRAGDEAIVTRWTKQANESVKPGMTEFEINTIHGKATSTMVAEREEWHETEGKKAAAFTLDATLLAKLKAEWDNVDRPENYKQRALSAQVRLGIAKTAE